MAKTGWNKVEWDRHSPPAHYTVNTLTNMLTSRLRSGMAST
jgi:hypothetical protein